MSKSNQFNTQFTERVMAKIQARQWLGRLRNVLLGLLVIEFFAVAIELARNNIDLFPKLLIHDFQAVSSHFPTFVSTFATSLPWLGLASLILTAILYGILQRYETIVGRNRITDTTTNGDFRMPLTIIGSTKRTIATGAALAVLFGGASVYAAVDNSNHQAAVHASQTAYVKTSTHAQGNLKSSDSSVASKDAGKASNGSTSASGTPAATSSTVTQTGQGSVAAGSGITTGGQTNPQLFSLTGVYGHLYRKAFTPGACSDSSCNLPVQGTVTIEHYVGNNPNAAVVVLTTVQSDENGNYHIELNPGYYRLTGVDGSGNRTAQVNLNVAPQDYNEVNLYFTSLMSHGPTPNM